MTEIVRFEATERVALLRFDDGAPERLEAGALETPAQLGKLPRGAYVETKRKLRGGMLARVRATLAADMATWSVP